LRSASTAEGEAMAKLTNNAPVMRGVVWTMRQGGQPLGTSEVFQLLPCMDLSFSPVVVDPDGDQLYTRRDLISAPDGGRYGQNKSYGCANNNYTFNLPGTYAFRYLTSDGIAETPNYDFTIVIDPLEQARGVLLEQFSAKGTVNEQATLLAWPYSITPRAGSVGASAYPDTGNATVLDLRLTAKDGDYTIEGIETSHINGTTLTPWIEGISEGQVIRQGESVDVRLVTPPFTCLRTEETLYEGFHWGFRIREIPQATFVYERWRGAILNNGATPWPSCPSP
jgi:hypothetical protein